MILFEYRFHLFLIRLYHSDFSLMTGALLPTGLLCAIIRLFFLYRNIISALYSSFHFFKIFKICVLHIFKIIEVFVFLLKSWINTLIWGWFISDDILYLWNIDPRRQDLARSFWRVLVFCYRRYGLSF
jgi:hypothetical protein